jgi:hypothetical protein
MEEVTIGKAHANTQKLNRNVSMVTAVFLNQKRMNVCEHTTKMASLEFLKGGCEEWMEGNLKGNYLIYLILHILNFPPSIPRNPLVVPFKNSLVMPSLSCVHIYSLSSD